MMTEEQRRLYEMIPIGKKNAISRKELAEKWQMPDRDVRDTIAVLRREFNRDYTCDYAILSASNAAGYWRSDDNAEIVGFNREAEHRMKMIARSRMRTVGEGLLSFAFVSD